MSTSADKPDISLVPDIDIEEGEGDFTEIPYEPPKNYLLMRSIDDEPLYDEVFIKSIDPSVHFYLVQLQKVIPPGLRGQVLLAAILQPDPKDALEWIEAIKAIQLADEGFGIVRKSEELHGPVQK